MSFVRIRSVFSVLVLLITAICIIQPVLGANGTVSIVYRGSGGSYIGDTVIFDGQNTAGNITYVRITGPYLPPEGVPIYDLNGNPGSGNTIETRADGTWKLAWYTSSIKGIEKMQTARYYLTAADLAHPEISSTTSLVMKKAEFFAVITPDSATSGDYVSVTGTADRGLTYVLIELADPAGTTLRTYSSPVSATGYFNYGFHVDMKPGQYTIRVSNPAIKNPLQKVLTVLPPRTPAPVVTTVAVTPDIPTAAITASLPVQPPTSPVISTGSGSLSIASTPPGAFVYLDSVMMGKTPVELGNLGFGTHLVEIRSQGYMPYSVQVTVSEGAAVTLSPILVKTPSSLPLSPVTALAAFVICGAIAILYRKK